MAIVRYRNKSSGTVYLYEVERYVDENGKRRQRRHYLGTEDPQSKKLIPSTHKRGRKNGFSPGPAIGTGTNYKDLYLTVSEANESLTRQNKALEKRCEELEKENVSLRLFRERIVSAVDESRADKK